MNLKTGGMSCAKNYVNSWMWKNFNGKGFDTRLLVVLMHNGKLQFININTHTNILHTFRTEVGIFLMEKNQITNHVGIV